MSSLAESCSPIVLPPEERQYVAAMSASRAAEFAAGRCCARRALAAIGIPAAVGRGSDRAPQWPPGIVGSISHTGRFSLAVVARRSEIAGLGVDIELLGRVRRELWPIVFRPAEAARLEAEPAERQPVLASIMFSAKEAYFKFQYPIWRAWLDYREAMVSILDPDGLEVRPIATGRAAPGAGVFAVADGLVAVCIFRKISAATRPG
jgi:4'-phosphopantetheinyl transferase EntD